MGIAIGDLVIRRSISKGIKNPMVPVGADGRVVEFARGEWVVRWTEYGVVSIPDADIRCSRHRRNRNRVCGCECNNRKTHPWAFNELTVRYCLIVRSQ